MGSHHLHRHLCLLAFGVALILTNGCGGGGSSTPLPPANNPVPLLSAISPEIVSPTHSAQTLRVTGARFSRASIVRLNGKDRPTTFISSTELTAQVSADDVANAGTAAITVFNPPPGGGTTSPLTIAVEPRSVDLWRVAELGLNTQSSYANPFVDVTVTARFDGPSGQSLIMKGFYDGDGIWRVRFAPSEVGTWRYQTSATSPSDKGLHGISGTLEVGTASSPNPLYQHGGFLRVSDNARYLTYTDGTPFFWLGDTWWFAPSSLLPIDGQNPAFKILIDKRAAQRFTIVQMNFLGPEWDKMHQDMDARTIDVARWKEVDRYFQYANEHGIIPVFGLAFHVEMEMSTLEDWKFLWSYVVARYAATPVTFLICGEYNLYNDPTRVGIVLPLGSHIKESDPYKRAMSVHPWGITAEQRQAWTQAWYDFTMVQTGHPFAPEVAPPELYSSAYNSEPSRPLLEAESDYEGLNKGTVNEIMPEQTRRAAYYAIQMGSFGYTYGAEGLWYPTQSQDDHSTGDSMPWWESMNRPGALQMTYLRNLYESVQWWKLEPRHGAASPMSGVLDAEGFQPRVKADADNVYFVWFPYGSDPTAGYRLLRKSEVPVMFNASWFDPQTGTSTDIGNLSCPDVACVLPARPNSNDWVLALKR